MKHTYAIVDIETTGSHASANGITEIAIILHDGEKVIHIYQKLINPKKPIPLFIQSLTGITDSMLEDCPEFEEVAEEIYHLLKGKIFVAHNVNFDYSFVNHHLLRAGYELHSKKLCTVRLARKIFPGIKSYSLGKLCRHFNIEITNRHRAGGDAEATAVLFKMMLDADDQDHIKNTLNSRSKEQILPPHVPREELLQLPHLPGVYYFKDKKAKVIYVGKAINLYKRVFSHFSNNNTDKKKQDFLRKIRTIHYQVCGTELQALILETIEIKRLWPEQNRALKNPEQRFGLYVYEDQRGYSRLAIGKKTKHFKPAYQFNNMADGYSLLKRMIDDFGLCPKMCSLQSNTGVCISLENQKCNGICFSDDAKSEYNLRVDNALKTVSSALPTFAIIDDGRTKEEKSLILMENGIFYGMGYVKNHENYTSINDVKSLLTRYPSYSFIHNIIEDFALKNPHKRILFN